jgi:hypothetical protein
MNACINLREIAEMTRGEIEQPSGQFSPVLLGQFRHSVFDVCH